MERRALHTYTGDRSLQPLQDEINKALYSDAEVAAHWENEFLPIARAADCAALHAELLEGAKSRRLADELHQKLGDLGDPCICERCQAEHYGGNYFLCPDCEPSATWDDIVFTITEDLA